MALSIGILKGSRIQVGPQLLEVVQIIDPSNVVVRVDEGPEFHIYAMERTEISPEVYIFCGAKNEEPMANNGTRIAFEAPRHVRINRVPMQVTA